MIYDKICVMVPTYKRIERIKTILDSAIETADDVSRLRFSLCVNVDDTPTREYLAGREWPTPDCWEIIDESTRQPNLSLYFNKMYDETRFNGEDTLASELGDDMVFVTPGWDTRVLEAINNSNGMAIVYCNDDFIAHEKCCVNLFVTRTLVTLTRKPFMCKFFHADMVDMIWTMLGSMTGLLHYMGDVIIRHDHSSKKSSEDWDETFHRLAPVQKAANSKDNQRLAVAYATLIAKILIQEGVGKWNVLR